MIGLSRYQVDFAVARNAMRLSALVSRWLLLYLSLFLYSRRLRDPKAEAEKSKLGYRLGIGDTCESGFRFGSP